MSIPSFILLSFALGLCAACLVVAVAALAGWAWTLVRLNASFLPYAQGLQALQKLNDLKDESIRAVLANFERKQQKEPGIAGRSGEDEIAEIRRRAEAMGFSVDKSGIVSEQTAPLPPVPDALDVNLPTIDVVE